MLHPCEFQKWLNDCVENARKKGMPNEEIQFILIRVLNDVATSDIATRSLEKEKS